MVLFFRGGGPNFLIEERDAQSRALKRFQYGECRQCLDELQSAPALLKYLDWVYPDILSLSAYANKGSSPSIEVLRRGQGNRKKRIRRADDLESRI